MTIVLAGTFAGRGGIQTHLHWLACALLEAGHKVRVCSLGQRLGASDKARVKSLQDIGDFDVNCPQFAKDGAAKGALGTGLALIRILRNAGPDVYFACGTGWNLFLPAILSGACPRRVFHEVMSGHSSGRRDTRHLVRMAFHEVLAQATPVAATFRQQFGWGREVQVLPAFPEPLEVIGRLPQARTGSIASGKIRAAFFSRLVPHKGALWLVQQWPRLERWLAELHIYGTGPEEQPIRDLIGVKGWQNQVFCHGAYPDGQAYADLLGTFDLTLLPTLGSEGAPLVLLESMACAVPFVAYGVGGIPDYANPDCEIADPGTPDSFIHGVDKIAKKLSLGVVDQSRLQTFYLGKFSFSRLKALWLEFLVGGGSQ